MRTKLLVVYILHITWKYNGQLMITDFQISKSISTVYIYHEVQCIDRLILVIQSQENLVIVRVGLRWSAIFLPPWRRFLLVLCLRVLAVVIVVIQRRRLTRRPGRALGDSGRVIPAGAAISYQVCQLVLPVQPPGGEKKSMIKSRRRNTNAHTSFYCHRYI